MEIIARTARRHLCHQLGAAFNVAVFTQASLSAALRVNEQTGIRLGLVVQIQPHRAIVSCLYPRGAGFVQDEPSHEMTVGPAM